MRTPDTIRQSCSGSSLITTLLVITVLTIIVVAFMQSMSIERMTSRSYANIAKAELISNAGMEVALNLLRALEEAPYASVFIQDGEGQPYPFLFRRVWNEAAESFEESYQPSFSTRVTETSLSAFPTAFYSADGYNIDDLDLAGEEVSRALDRPEDIWMDLNTSLPSHRNGIIGLTDGDGNRTPLPVNWTYIHDTEGRVVGRYAFWIDDESTKIDLRTAGNTAGEDDSHLRANGENLNEVAVHALQSLPGAEGLGGEDMQDLLNLRTEFFSTGTPFIGQNLVDRSFFRFQEEGDPNPTLDRDNEELWQTIAPHLTVFSRNDDRAPDGRRKLDLNQVVTNTLDPDEVQEEVEVIRDFILETLPGFSQRAHNGEVTEERQRRYATKLAANIRDMIDDDNVATVILNDGTAYIGSTPDPELGDTLPLLTPLTSDLPIAFGKEKGPFLSEYTRFMKVISGHSTGTDIVQVRPVHYVELHNISDEAITYEDLEPNPFIRIANRAAWSATPAGTFRPADIVMRLPEDFVIEPNSYAVITTDAAPFPGSHPGLLGPTDIRFQLERGSGPGTWSAVDAGGQNMPEGADFEDYSLNLATTSSNRYQMQTNVRPTGYGTNETRLIFGNDDGLFDMVVKAYEESNLYLGRDVRNPTMHNTNIAGNVTTTDNNGGTGHRFTRADPRTNTEVGELQANTKSVWIDGLASYGNNIFMNGRMTQGGLNHSTDFAATNHTQALTEWIAAGENRGNHLILNEPLSSLGQLGFLYDPARFDQTYRGGARTLRIGQSDDPSNFRPGLSAQWHGGYGHGQASNAEFQKSANRLLSIFRIDSATSGLVNPHAVNRSAIAPAMLGVMENFEFLSPEDGGDSASAGRSLALDADEIPLLVADLAAEIQAGRPFFDAGELSNVTNFHTGGRYVNNVQAQNLRDSAREEFLRRSFNLLSTHSLGFTVHVVAQTGRFSSTHRFIPEATVRRSRVVNLVPTYPEPYDEMVPTAPESWEVQTLRETFH